MGVDIDSIEEINKTKALEEAILRFDAIYNSVSIGIAILDKNGVLMDCNSVAIKIFGVDNKQEWMESKVCFENDPNFSATVIDYLRSGDNDVSIVHYDFDKVAKTDFFKTNNKGRRVLEIRTSNLINSNGGHLGYVMTFVDVTEPKYQEMVQDTINNNIPIGIELYDKDGKLIFLNPIQVKTFGVVDVDNILNVNIFDDPNTSDDIKNKIRAGENFDYEVEYDFDLANKLYYKTTISGKRFFGVKNVAVRNDNGDVVGYMLTNVDITQRIEQQRDENDLKMSLEIIMKAGDVSLWKYDIAQRTFCAVFGEIFPGATYDECLGALADDSKAAYTTIFENLINGQKDTDATILHFIDPNTGKDLFYRTKIAIFLDSNGNRNTIIGTQKNITEDLIQKRKLEEFEIKTKLTNEKNHIIQWDYDIEQQHFITQGNGAIREGELMSLDTYITYLHPDDRQIIVDYVDQMSRRELASVDIVVRSYIPGYEDYRYVVLNVLPLKDSLGNIVSYTGIRRDATEETLQRKKLAEKTYKTNFVAKVSGFTPWEYDCGRQILISDDDNVLGREMQLEEYFALVYPSDKNSFDRVNDIMRGCKDESFSVDVKYKVNNEWRYATIAGEPYERDCNGVVVRYLGYRNDTTAIVLMNENIREGKFKTDLAIKNANMVMWEYVVADKMFTAFNDPLTNYDATAAYSPEDYIATLDANSVDDAVKIVALMNRRELGEFSFKSKIMLPNSQKWDYITIHGAHSEVSATDPTKATKYIGFRVDNTELVKLSQGLEESNALTSTIVAQSPSAIFIKDITDDWKYVIANNLFCQIFDYTESQVIGYNDFEMFDIEVATKFREDDLKAINSDGAYSFVEEVITDGVIKALHTTKRVITTTNGRQLLIGISSDISETIAQQRALEKSHQYLNLALEAGNVSTWLYKVDEHMFYSLRKDGLMGDGVDLTVSLKAMHPDDKQKLEEMFSEIIAGKRDADNIILRYVSDDIEGGYKYFENRMIAIKNDGNTVIITGTQKDITYDVLRTKKIEDTQKYLDLAIDAGKVAVWGYDPKKDIVLNISGEVFNKDVMPLQAANDSVHPDDLPAFAALWQKLTNGESDKETLCMRFKNPFTDKYEYIDKSMIALRSASGELDMIIGTHHDVTKDKLHKIALEDSNEKLSMALDVIRAFSWHCDLRDGVLLFDSNFISFGFDPEAMNSMRKFAQHIHSEDREEFLAIMDDFCNKTDGEFISTYRIDLKNDGHYEWWECRGKMKIMSENGQTYKSIYGMDCNVTHHKQITDELTQAKVNSDNAYIILNNIVQQIPCGLLIKDIDDDLRYMFVNDKLAKFHNLPIDAFAGRTDYEILPKEVADNLYNENQMTIALNGEVYVKSITSEEDGVINIWEVTEVICRNTDGRRLLIGLITNITERERAQIELKKSKERAEEANSLLQSIIRQIPFGLYIKDIDNDFRYVIMNDVLAKIDGLDNKEAIGKTDYELFDKTIADLFKKESVLAVSRAEGELTVVKNNIDWGGGNRVYENSDTVITVANGRRLLIGVVADVTEKEQMLHDVQEAKERAEQSDKLKSAFLANMSHEIRTPLNAIVGFSELLIEADDAAEREEYTNIISANNELLLRLIGDILDLSKIESGMIELKSEKFDISDICDEVYMMLKQKVTNPNVDFRVENPYYSCVVELDKNRLTQVGINFITNAIKYTEQGMILMGYEYINSGVRIYVTDSGIGIDEKNHDKVFDRFEKFDTFAQGTGLGLSICRAIINAQGGEIGFESELGLGSTFWAWFPCEAQIQELDANGNNVVIVDENVFSVKPISDRNNFKILIAEDNDSNFLLIKHILKDFVVTRANNGAEAVEYARTGKFDAILLDWKMPVMNGLESTRQIRLFDKNIPIVAVTANAFDSNKNSFIEAGCNAFVAKPLKRKELLEVLNKLM